MAKLPTQSTVDKINALYDKHYPRPHLGGSVIGHQCRRYLVYSFFWAYQSRIESKLNRIFRIGDAVEDLVIKDLKRIGIQVRHKDENGQQLKVDGFAGHAGGSVDGILSNVSEYPNEEILFECKSANHTNFLDMKRKTIKVSKPQYYSQAIIYMGKLNLNTCLFAVMDKNTSEIHIEFIPFDQDEFEELLRVEQDVIRCVDINEFPKVSTNPSWYSCKYCDASNVCHHGITPERNCRTCDYVVLAEEGKWACSNEGFKELNKEAQENGCENYRLSIKFLQPECVGEA